MQADHLLLVQTTFEQRIHAEELSVDLIEKHLAACVQISGPVSSVYRWKGELQHEEEYILTAKTFGEYYEKVAACIEKKSPLRSARDYCHPSYLVQRCLLEVV